MCNYILNYSINLSNIAHTGLFLVIWTTGTSFNFHIRQHLVRNLGKFIRLYLTASGTTWLHWRKLVNMVPFIKNIWTQWATMLSNYWQKPTHYKKTHIAMDKSEHLATSYQIPVHEMYVIQHKMVLEKSTITKQYHC